MTMPTNQCPQWMQVYHVMRGTPDVWTISLVYRDYYPYRAGQYVLVSVRNLAEILHACTISSTLGVSEYITLTVRRIDDGVDSQWLTRDVKRGNYLWLSDAMGEFTCDDRIEDKSLLLATGCGVAPIMSIRRWLAKSRPQADVWVIYNVRTPQDIIFADKWRGYPVTLVVESNVIEGFIAGRSTCGLLVGISDSTLRIVMTCGPASYMDWVEQKVKVPGVTCFFEEKFLTPIAEAATSGLKLTELQPAREFYTPVDTTLLEALESNNVPVVAACRASACGCCKIKVVSDEHTVSSTMTLTDAEVAEGYVLVCSYHPQGGLVLA